MPRSMPQEHASTCIMKSQSDEGPPIHHESPVSTSHVASCPWVLPRPLAPSQAPGARASPNRRALWDDRSACCPRVRTGELIGHLRLWPLRGTEHGTLSWLATFPPSPHPGGSGDHKLQEQCAKLDASCRGWVAFRQDNATGHG